VFVGAADPNSDHGLAVAMMIVAELGELLPGYEKGGLPMREALLALGELERRGSNAIEYVAHDLTNSLRIFG
jgi:hypothetical protein